MEQPLDVTGNHIVFPAPTITYKKSYKYSQKIVIILLAIALLFFSSEVMARICVRNDWVLDTTSYFSDTHWLLLWEKRGNKSQPTDYPMDSYHPLLGWYPLINAKNVPNGNGVVNFNSEGIRGLKSYKKEKSPGITRIVVVGDSFSFGEEINDDETYSAQLEQLMPNTEVLNMAVHGYGLDQMYLRLNLDGFKYNPDIAIFAFIGDDINRTVLTFRDYMKPKYILNNGKIQLTNTPIPLPKELIQKRRYRIALLDLLSLLRDRFYFQYNPNPDLTPLTKALLINAGEDIRKHNALPVLLYLPTKEEMINTQTNLLDTEQLMFSVCQEMKMLCLSARKYLVQAFLKGENYNINVHYQKKTNEIIAQGLYEDLKKYANN
jgi:hypothetical protein